jgi:hypothetical protein
VSNIVTVYLPPATDIVVKGFTNAANLQRITVTPPTGSPSVFQGSGEGNTPIGRTHFTTPSGDEAQITVEIDYSPDGGSTWQPSDVYTDGCAVQSYNLTVIVSEDLVDEDYNDAICLVSWPQAERAEG